MTDECMYTSTTLKSFKMYDCNALIKKKESVMGATALGCYTELITCYDELSDLRIGV